MSDREPDILGCPACGSENLSLAQIAFEAARFYTDGHCEAHDGVYDYGGVIAVSCDACTWSMGSMPPTIDTDDFVRTHQEMIRAEMLKEMQRD